MERIGEQKQLVHAKFELFMGFQVLRFQGLFFLELVFYGVPSTMLYFIFLLNSHHRVTVFIVVYFVLSVSMSCRMYGRKFLKRKEGGGVLKNK